MDKFQMALCMDHQFQRTRTGPTPTKEAKRLAEALSALGWRVELEKFDGYKHIDIAITEARVNIEVDGPRHWNEPKQALVDLQRNYYSFNKGYVTFRIPNCLVEDEKILGHTAKYLDRILRSNSISGFDYFDDDDFDYDEYYNYDDDDEDY